MKSQKILNFRNLALLLFLTITSFACSDNSNLYFGEGAAIQASTISPAPPPITTPNPNFPPIPGTYPYEGTVQATFFQKKTTNKVDIIVSIDNSGSMQPHIEKVAKNISVFTNYLIQQKVDFHIGIVKNSEDDDGFVHPHFRGPHPIIKSTDINIPSKINANLQAILESYVGGYELGVTVLRSAIHLPINQILFRNDAAKVFIVLTDAYDNEAIDSSFAPGIINEFDKFSSEYAWMILGIGWPSSASPQENCGVESTNHELLETLVRFSSGFMGNICVEDYSSILNNAATRITSFLREFSLARFAELHAAKILKVHVFVNGTEIAENPVNGFVWNPATLSISFPGSYVPQEGSKIEVRIDYEMP